MTTREALLTPPPAGPLAQSSGGAAGTSAPRRRRGPRLATVGQAVGYVASIVRRVEAGEMETARARTLLYAVQVLSQLLQGAELERRLDALEQASASRRFAA